MATTFEPYSGDNSTTTFAFSHPSYQESDIKVTVDGTPYTNTGVTGGSPGATTFTIPSYTTSNAGNIAFNTAPGNGAVIRIFRDTNVDVAKATFQSGSSVKAADLNNTVTQLLYAAQEEQNQLEQTADIQDSAITSAKIKDDTIVNADIKSDAAIAGTKVTPAFGSQNLSTSGTAATGALTVTGNIAVSGTVDGRDVATDGSKLDGIEAGATGDQTAAQIRTLVGAATDSNVFTDADHTKLNNIEDNATADQTSTDIKTLLQSDNLTDAHLAENSVGTSEIKDDAVGPDQLANTSVTAGNYGGSTAIPSLTVDSQGRLTAVSNNVVSFDVEADTSPSLGGNLDVENKEIITTTTNQDIILTPNGSGAVTVKGTGSASGSVKFNSETNGRFIQLKAPANSALSQDYTFTLPVNDGDAGQFLKTDGIGNLSWDTVSGGGGGGGTAAPNNIVSILESPNGNRTDFSMSVTPASAQNLIVSVNGVVQNPNAGTTIASSAEGYCVDGATLKFATAPANGSSIFIVELSATTASDRIVEGNSNVDIFDDNSTSRAVVNLDGNEKFRVNEGGQIGLGGANYGTDGQVLTSQGSGAAAQWESIPAVNTDLVNDTSPQLGGNLDVQASEITTSTTNGNIKLTPNGTGVIEVKGASGNDGTLQLNCSQNSHGVKIKSPAHSAGASYTLTLPVNDGNANQVLKTDGSGVLAWVDQTTDTVVGGATGVDFNDNVKARFGTGNDLEIFVDSNNASHIKQMTDGQYLNLHANDFWVGDQAGVETYIIANHNDAVKLYYDNEKVFETTAAGTKVGRTSSSNSYIEIINSGGTSGFIYGSSNDQMWIMDREGHAFFKGIKDGSAELYYDNAKKLHTAAGGITTTGYVNIEGGSNGQLYIQDSGKVNLGSQNDFQIFHDSADSYINNSTGTLYARGDTISLNAMSTTDKYFDATNGGAATLYHDNVQKITTGTNYNLVYATSNGNPAGLKIRNVDNNSNYSHAELRLESKNAASYGTIFNDHANGCVRIGHNTTGNTLEVFNDGVIRAQGIKFGSDTSSANDLDDYEEGTFTPVVSNGMTGASYNVQRGGYIKIGRFVYFQVDLGINGGTGNSNQFKLGGLPFTSASSNTTAYGGAFINYQGGTFGKGEDISLHIGLNETTVKFYKHGGATVSGNDTTAIPNIQSNFLYQGTYMTA